MLMRSLVLPFLLGFKFSLSSLIPLLFGVLLLVTKKALLLTKVALLISGLLGWNSMTTGWSGYPGGYPHVPSNSFAPGLGAFGEILNNHHHHDISSGGLGGSYHNHHYPHRPYRTPQTSPDFPTYGQHVVREVVNVYDVETDQSGSSQNSARDGKKFVWSTREWFNLHIKIWLTRVSSSICDSWTNCVNTFPTTKLEFYQKQNYTKDSVLI